MIKNAARLCDIFLTNKNVHIERLASDNLSDVAIIGDQLYKDILGGNRVGIKTILVNPMSLDDMFLTKLIFRPLEKRVYKKLAHNGVLERGKYYE